MQEMQAKYRTTSNGVLNQETGQNIPDDEANRHWVEYLEWVSAGGTADPQFTPEEIDANAVGELAAALTSDLKNVDRILLKLIIELASVLISKGLITKADLGADLVDLALGLRDTLSDLEMLDT